MKEEVKLIRTNESYRRDIRNVLKSVSELIDILISEEDLFQRTIMKNMHYLNANIESIE